MPFSLQAFMAAQFAGQQLNADLEDRRVTTQMKKAQISQMAFAQQREQMQMDNMKQVQAQLAKLIGDHDNEQQAQQVDNGTAPDTQKEQQLTQEADQYRKVGKAFLVQDPAKSEAFFKMADTVDARRTKLSADNLKLQEKRVQDLASFAGSVLDGGVPAADAFNWVKEHVGLKAAMEIPADPAQAKAFWRAKQLQGTTAAEQLADARRISEDKARETDREERRQQQERFHKDLESDKAAQRELIKQGKAAAAEDRAERKASAAASKEFQQTEALNKQVNKEAKPLLDDKARIDEIEGLLKVNSSSADQQVHQALTSMLGNFKGRATNKFYSDNKNFGSVASRLTGFLSHGFAGRYQESDRAMIGQMLEGLKSNTIEPALASLEKRTKEKAKGYGLKEDQVAIDAEFNRNAKPAGAAPDPGTVVKGYKFKGGDPADKANWEKI